MRKKEKIFQRFIQNFCPLLKCEWTNIVAHRKWSKWSAAIHLRPNVDLYIKLTVSRRFRVNHPLKKIS